MTRSVFLKNNFLSIIWSFIILILTLAPGKVLPPVKIFEIDKAVHFFIFGVLMFLTLSGLKKQYISYNRAITISFLFCICYGIFIELIQNFIPGRQFSIYDIIANTIGVVLGYFIFKIFKKNNSQS